MMSELRDRVAVTGIGIVSPIGFGRQQFWTALCEGRSGIVPLERFRAPDDGPRLAAEVRGFAAREFITSVHLRRMDNVSRMLVAASRMALDDARIAAARVPPERIGIVAGSVLADISESVLHLQRVFTKGPAAASPMLFPNLVLNAPASYVSMELGITGVNLTVSQGEISGEQAIVVGCDLIRSGRADVVLAGAGDELDAIVFEVYRRARALSSQRGGDEWSSPYDRDRNGVILGEGAAMLVLEPSAAAHARGATVYAEVDECTIFSVPAPLYDWPATAPAARAPLRRLLDGVGEHRRPVDLICGAANSSRRLDACEIELFAQLLGESARNVYLTSVKGAAGEFGSAGALNVAAACLALRQQRVPPLCHLRTPEPAAPFRFAAPSAAEASLQGALVCGIGRGGVVAALLLRRSAG